MKMKKLIFRLEDGLDDRRAFVNRRKRRQRRVRLGLIPISRGRDLHGRLRFRKSLQPALFMLPEADCDFQGFVEMDRVGKEESVGEGAVHKRKVAVSRVKDGICRKTPTEPKRILESLKFHGRVSFTINVEFLVFIHRITVLVKAMDAHVPADELAFAS